MRLIPWIFSNWYAIEIGPCPQIASRQKFHHSWNQIDIRLLELIDVGLKAQVRANLDEGQGLQGGQIVLGYGGVRAPLAFAGWKSGWNQSAGSLFLIDEGLQGQQSRYSQSLT